MGRYRRKKMHKGDKPMKEKYRTKRRTRDKDQIFDDMKSPDKMLHQPVDDDKPGAAQFYCLHCAKHCVDEPALKSHFKGQPHKRRLKALETEPYTQEEADRAAGMGSYIAPKKQKVYTQGTQDADQEGDTTMKPEVATQVTQDAEKEGDATMKPEVSTKRKRDSDEEGDSSMKPA